MALEYNNYSLVKITLEVVNENLSPSRLFLQLDNVEIRGKKGSLHFIRFPTAEMGNFLALAKAKGSECRRALWKFMENIFTYNRFIPVSKWLSC